MTEDLATRAARFTGSFPRSTADVALRLARAAPEPIIEPSQPIFDPHHHAYGRVGDRNYYTLADLVRDLGSGHRIMGTAYVEAYEAGWRTEGPEELRTVGEVETIVAQTRAPIDLPTGPCRIAAGVIAFADLMLGDRVDAVLDALAAAGEGRLRGIRYRTAVTSGVVGRTIVRPPRPHLLIDAQFQRGVARLEQHRLPFDVWAYDEQLHEVAALADAFPNIGFVVDHLGGPVGVVERREELGERRRRWTADLRALGRRPNVTMKLGGMAMTVFGFGFEFSPEPPGSEQMAAAWRDNFEICLDAFGADRCMFESNFPVDAQGAGYATIWNAFKRLARGLSADERRALFYGAATTAYDLKEIASACDRALTSPLPTIA